MKRITTFSFQNALVIVLLSLSFQSSVEAQCSFTDSQKEADYEAIVALYYSNPGNWFSNSWDELATGNSCDVCALSGVICDSDGLVIQLYINNKQLSTLPPEIGNLSALEVLHAYENNITALPPEVGNLAKLRSLIIRNNQLTSLPPEIGNLTNLKKLRAEVNDISSLPIEIGNLVNLERLVLFQNSISTLPSEIGNLVNLNNFSIYTRVREV